MLCLQTLSAEDDTNVTMVRVPLKEAICSVRPDEQSLSRRLEQAGYLPGAWRSMPSCSADSRKPKKKGQTPTAGMSALPHPARLGGARTIAAEQLNLIFELPGPGCGPGRRQLGMKHRTLPAQAQAQASLASLPI